MNMENFAFRAAPTPAASSPDQVWGPFDTALARYVTRLVQVSNALAERQQGAARIYFETAEHRLQQKREFNTREYEGLLSAMQTESADQIASAQTAYLESIQTLQNAVLEVTKAALEDYLAEMHSAWQEAQAECQAAYREYVADIAGAFDVGADAIDPSTLSFIAQALASAAAYASMSMQFATALIPGMQKQFGFG